MKITLLLKYIKYDVWQLTHRAGQVRITDPELKDLAQMDDNESDEHLILRLALTGTARLRHFLKDYIERKGEDATDELPEGKQSWSFTFREDKADSHALAELMHWFVVRYAVYEWMGLFAPSEQAAARAELEDVADEIKEAMQDSDMPTKERRDISDPSEEYEVEITYVPEYVPKGNTDETPKYKF